MVELSVPRPAELEGQPEPASADPQELEPPLIDSRDPPCRPSTARAEEEQAQVSVLEEEVKGGSRDAWSHETEVSLDSKYRELIAAHGELDVQLQEVECSATLCRVVLSSVASEGPAEALPIVAEAVEWTGERLFQAIPGMIPRS